MTVVSKKGGAGGALGRAIIAFVAVFVVLGVISNLRTSSTGAPSRTIAPVVEQSLEDQMVLEVVTCTDEGAAGTVTNRSTETVDLFIETNYLDSAGVVLDDGIDSVSGVRPGETANWDAAYLGDKDVARCRGSVSSAYAK